MRENWRVCARFVVLVLMFPATWLAQWAIEQYIERPTLETRLIAAVSTGDETELERALRDGASPTSCDEQGLTVLSYAAHQGDARIARRLIDAGADVNHADARGMTPLMWAVQGGHSDVVRVLVQRGADPMLRNNIGQTARDQAEWWNFTDIVDFLRDAERGQVCLNSNG